MKIERTIKSEVFLWLVAHDAIMTNSARQRISLSLSGVYTKCFNGTEDLMHTLRDCEESVAVWRTFLPPHLVNSFFGLHLKEWLDSQLQTIIDLIKGWK